MEKLKAIIIEDEEVSREILTNYISTYCPTIELVGEASNIETGEKLIAKENPDIVFLDIEMPYGNGFDLLERIKNINFEVIFITAYSNYAIKALNLSASSYILKPIDIDELVVSVEKIVKSKEKKETFSSTRVLAENIKAISNKDQKIVIPQMDGFEVVKISDIIRAEASDNYTVLYLVNGKKYMLSKTLKFYEDLLTEFGFLRTHKSHLLNLSQVVKYKKGKVGQAIMVDESVVLVTAKSRKEFMKYFV